MRPETEYRDVRRLILYIALAGLLCLGVLTLFKGVFYFNLKLHQMGFEKAVFTIEEVGVDTFESSTKHFAKGMVKGKHELIYNASNIFRVENAASLKPGMEAPVYYHENGGLAVFLEKGLRVVSVEDFEGRNFYFWLNFTVCVFSCVLACLIYGYRVRFIGFSN